MDVYYRNDSMKSGRVVVSWVVWKPWGVGEGVQSRHEEETVLDRKMEKIYTARQELCTGLSLGTGPEAPGSKRRKATAVQRHVQTAASFTYIQSTLGL